MIANAPSWTRRAEAGLGVRAEGREAQGQGQLDSTQRRGRDRQNGWGVLAEWLVAFKNAEVLSPCGVREGLSRHHREDADRQDWEHS